MGFKVIVANELRYYRQILARAIEVARPDVEVMVVPPALLKTEVRRLEPDLVVCSCARPAVEAGTRAWIELYPDHGPVSVVCVEGLRSSIQTMELDDIFRFIDRVSARKRGTGAPGIEHETPQDALGGVARKDTTDRAELTGGETEMLGLANRTRKGEHTG
jgi:hypothetical protein